MPTMGFDGALKQQGSSWLQVPDLDAALSTPVALYVGSYEQGSCCYEAVTNVLYVHTNTRYLSYGTNNGASASWNCML